MNYKVIYEDFGTDGINGFVTRIKPDQYLIGINTRLPEADQEQTLKHELYHIEQGHFDGTRSVDQIESETHEAVENCCPIVAQSGQ